MRRMTEGGVSSVGWGGPARLPGEVVTRKLSIGETSALCMLRKEESQEPRPCVWNVQECLDSEPFIFKKEGV